jgi:hypothetical protein
MTLTGWEIVGLDDRKLPLGKTIGDAVRDLVRKRWPHHTAKMIERHWGLDPKTAKNVVASGHVSERTLTKAVRAEGWGFLEALGREVTGESYADHLTRIIERDADVQRDRERERDTVRRMEARTRELDRVPPRPPA